MRTYNFNYILIGLLLFSISSCKEKVPTNTKIEVTFKQTQNSIRHDEIWLNGIHVWEMRDGTIDPYIVL
jgi:hypothetical protein